MRCNRICGKCDDCDDWVERWPEGADGIGWYAMVFRCYYFSIARACRLSLTLLFFIFDSKVSAFLIYFTQHNLQNASLPSAARQNARNHTHRSHAHHSQPASQNTPTRHTLTHVHTSKNT